MITGTEIRAARQRAGLTQGELAQRVGVTLRTVGNWERGEVEPRNSEARILSVLADHLDDGSSTHLRSASDGELLAEIARRLERARQRAGEEHGQDGSASNTPARDDPADLTNLKPEVTTPEQLNAEVSERQPAARRGRGRRR